MAIRVAEGAATRICDQGDRFALQVRAPSDLAAAMEALRRARTDIVDLGAAWVSEVVAAPAGPLLHGDRGDDEALLRRMPGIVARHLDAAGVTDAVVDAPELRGVLDRLDDLGPAVVLRLFPGAGARSLPPPWVDVAAEWIASGLVGDDVIRARVLAVEADVRVADVPALLHECAIARAPCEIVMGDMSRRIRAAAVAFERDGYPHVALAAGGPDLDDDELIARADLLEDVARHLAPQLAYGCVDIEPTFAWLRCGPGPDALAVLSALAGHHVPDAYPFQILGPGHIARLGGPPAGALSLPGGRYELRIDDPSEQGRDLLGPCLVSGVDIDRVVRELPDHVLDEEPVPATPPPSPVLATFVRWWRGALGDADRRRLEPLDRQATTTAAHSDLDHRRRWMAVEWLVKEHAAAWLRAAGDDRATDLGELGPLSDPQHLAAAVAVMRDRRHEALADDGEGDDGSARWERAAAEAALPAAAEAATLDLDEHVAGSGESFEAARRAMGDMVWRRAWDAADEAVEGLLGTTVGDVGDVADAERAGRDALAAGGADAWQDALVAAGPWVAAARQHLDDAEWEQALAAATDTASALLALAADHAARAVVVAAAREATTAAGRTVAAADPAALGPVVDELRESAFALLARMIDLKAHGAEPQGGPAPVAG